MYLYIRKHIGTDPYKVDRNFFNRKPDKTFGSHISKMRKRDTYRWQCGREGER